MLDTANFNPMIKEHYAPNPVINMAGQKNKAWGLLGKRNRRPQGVGGGKYWVQPIQFGLPGAGSVHFATAMAAVNNQSEYAAFQVTRKQHYRRAEVQNEVIEATATGDTDAFEEAFDEFDKAIMAEGNYLNFRLFRTGGGSIARMTNTNFATPIMALDDAAGVWALRGGDVVNLSATDGTSGVVKVGSLTVLSVQRRAGTVTFTTNIATGIPTAAQNDFIFLAGDFQVSSSGGSASGFQDWIPDADPTATPFYTVNRSLEPEMLGGLRVSGTDGRPVHELMIDMVVEADNMGAEPDIMIANPRALGSLTKQLEGKWVIMKGREYGGREAQIGYKGWQVTIEGHEVTIFSDRCCQTKRLWLLQSDTWTLFSAGTMPKFLLQRGGNMIKPSETSDSWESRIGEYWNAACKAPGFNTNGQLA